MVSLGAEKAVLQTGEPLVVIATSKRFEACMTTIDRLVLDRANGYRLVQHESRPSPVSDKPGGGPTTRSFTIGMTRHLQPGQFTYRAWVHSECRTGTHHQQLPDVDFQVL